MPAQQKTQQERRHKEHLQAVGARILSEANDLKRTVDSLANDLGMDVAEVKAVVAGEADVSSAQNVVQAMTQVYPVSLRDLWLDLDDTDHGVRILTAQQSKDSSRFFNRPDRHGNLTPFYEYRDTAMSRLAPFRPEWIQPLRIVEDNDPQNKDVVYNKGHLMFQGTFFIGEVNFYWESAGERHCAELNTGDSNFITPYTPHTFTSRNPDNLGLIIAVTYGGEVRRSLSDFAFLSEAQVDHLLADARDVNKLFTAQLARQLAAESLSPQQLKERLVARGIDEVRAKTIIASGGATTEELALVADALHVRLQDLMVAPFSADEEVIVTQHTSSPKRYYPDEQHPAYEFTELARSKHQPYHKSFDVRVIGSNGDMSHNLHEYIFNYGQTPVQLLWDDGRKLVLQPEDSAYVRPMVTHRFEPVAPDVPASLLMYRIPGGLGEGALGELSLFSPERRHRVLRENTQWF